MSATKEHNHDKMESGMRTPEVEFKGKCKGIRLIPRGKNDNHISVQIMTEDDENWFYDKSFSSYWIDELIEQLQMAKKYLETQQPDVHNGRQYGWKFKDDKKMSPCQYGFDGTDFKKPKYFLELLNLVGISKTPIKGQYHEIPQSLPAYLWRGENIKIVTANNPFTAKGYASFIGIEGEKKLVLKAVNYIESLTTSNASEGLEYIGFDDFQWE